MTNGNMDIYDKLQELSMYYHSTRAFGHTYALIHGAKNQTNGAVILGYNMQFAQNIARQCPQAIPVSWQNLHKLRGLHKPLVIDNSVMMELLYDSITEIEDLRFEVQSLYEEIQDLREEKLRIDKETRNEADYRKSN